ncbi:relaxase/mobilization nuclease domain-containing protein [Polaribacter sp. NJDZ03]|uniref:relaxase/mobilization nuclease domain-containing protein n=1 Tax=Polaribacter sp. NJDZ03 TaxID=2855841 RepID=UPI001C49D99F|nr:relaxase/mobilization nuclease domain-containing protein [Polaribacter sp. NJDZ03]
MISKAKSCPGGTALFNYVVNDNKGYELLRNNISGVTPKEMFSDMSILQQQNLRCKNNTISIILSPTINDSIKMTNEQLKTLTKDFLKEMDLDPKTNQFIAFVHTEKEHKHIHLILNRVKPDGTLIKDNFISKKAQFVAHEMALKHG